MLIEILCKQAKIFEMNIKTIWFYDPEVQLLIKAEMWTRRLRKLKILLVFLSVYLSLPHPSSSLWIK